MQLLSPLFAGVVAVFAAAASAQTPIPDALRASGDAVLEALRHDDLATIEARFNDRMRAVLPHERFMETAAKIRQQSGALRQCDAPTARRRGDVTVLTYRCDFAAAPLTVTLGWNDQGELAGLFFLPVAAEASKEPLPDGMREEAITTGATGWPLPATLLLPSTGKRVPVALLVHGSGPNDRDETVGPNKVFRDLAIGLAKQGIATLRYEKRTRALAERFVATAGDWTVDDEIVDDAVAALAQLAARNDLGPVFVIGHSEGALFAPRIAQRAARQGIPLGGIVMLAAPLTPLADVLVDQYEFLKAQPESGVSASMVADVKVKRDHVVALVAMSDGKPLRAALADPAVAGFTLPLDMPASAWLDIGRYDPAATLLAQPALPALLMFGGRDFQVRIQEKALWEARVGGRNDTTVVEYPALNHLLIEGRGPPSPAEYGRAGHVSAELIDGIGRWVGRHAGAVAAASR